MTTPAKQSHAEAVLGCVSSAGLLASLPFVMGLQLAAAAYTIRALWGWFIVPTLHFAPLSLIAAAGLDLTVSYICPSRTPSAKEDARGPWATIGYEVARHLFKSALFFGIGAVLHAWWPL